MLLLQNLNDIKLKFRNDEDHVSSNIIAYAIEEITYLRAKIESITNKVNKYEIKENNNGN